MLSSPDLYLGTFLILTGFALSLLNVRRIVNNSTAVSPVLLSENILLTCIGIAFISRSVYELSPEDVDMENMEERSGIMMKNGNESVNCDFKSVLMSYGPLVVSLVNSFLSLIIDNYMHYRMLATVRERDEENTVREVTEHPVSRRLQLKSFYMFFKKYFSFIAIALQWIVPVLMLLAMYPMEVKEKLLPVSDFRSASHSCMAMLDLNNKTCNYEDTSSNFTIELRKYESPTKYIPVYDNIDNVNSNSNSSEINTVVKNIYKIVANMKNNTLTNMHVTSPFLFRKSKDSQTCMKMCFIDNRKLLLYMFSLAIISYFVPITISTVILTKIHIMEVQKPNLKTYVSRELLYNILFWTPVMFDTFLSLILCSYSMGSVRTSIFNVIANIYQAVKNFMNTKYFKDNAILPV